MRLCGTKRGGKRKRQSNSSRYERAATKSRCAVKIGDARECNARGDVGLALNYSHKKKWQRHWADESMTGGVVEIGPAPPRIGYELVHPTSKKEAGDGEASSTATDADGCGGGGKTGDTCCGFPRCLRRKN